VNLLWGLGLFGLGLGLVMWAQQRRAAPTEESFLDG